MGQSFPLHASSSLRIVIGDAETNASSVADVVRFLQQQEAGDLADLLLSQPTGTNPPTLTDFCARMEALCAMV